MNTQYDVTQECNGRWKAWALTPNLNHLFQPTGGDHYTPLFRGREFQTRYAAERAIAAEKKARGEK